MNQYFNTLYYICTTPWEKNMSKILIFDGQRNDQSVDMRAKKQRFPLSDKRIKKQFDF